MNSFNLYNAYNVLEKSATLNISDGCSQPRTAPKQFSQVIKKIICLHNMQEKIINDVHLGTFAGDVAVVGLHDRSENHFNT